MEDRITSVVLVGDRFIAYATVNGNELSHTFMPDATVEIIKNWFDERVGYYADLKAKEELFNEELVLSQE